MQKFTIFIMLGLSLNYCSAQSDSVDVWISKIHNSQIYGTCNYFVTLEVDDGATEVKKLIEVGLETKEKLIEQITESDKGIISHYILSVITNTAKIESEDMGIKGYKFRINNLEFFEINNRKIVYQSDLETIKKYWIDYFHNSGE